MICPHFGATLQKSLKQTRQASFKWDQKEVPEQNEHKLDTTILDRGN